MRGQATFCRVFRGFLSICKDFEDGLMSLQAHTTPAQSSNYSGFSSEVMWKLVEIVEKHSADFAYPTHVNIHQNQYPKVQGTPAAA